jgi:hypothetical protein
MIPLIIRTLEDLKAARDEALTALQRNPPPKLPEEARPHWLFERHFDADGRVL